VFLKHLIRKFMKECGSKIKQQDCMFLDRQIVQRNKVGEVLKFGQTEATILETSVMELSKVMVFTFGLMVRATQASGYRTRCRVKATSSGLMVETLKVNLKTELCMDGAFTLGKTAVATRATIV